MFEDEISHLIEENMDKLVMDLGDDAKNNLSLFIIFYTIFQFTSFDVKTTQSFNDLGSNNYFSKVLIIALFSMAGVPPF